MKLYLLSLLLLRGAVADVLDLESRASNWTVGQTVQTTSGPVNGHPAPNNSDVSEYLGIPYAIPPIGDLRWTAPQNFTGNTPINGTSFVRPLSQSSASNH